MEQRRLFDTIGDKMLAMGARFPVVNSMLNAIRRKKSKDTIVLSAVIAGCVLFTFLYIVLK
jgi:Golgi SNAP receptor complex protein 1